MKWLIGLFATISGLMAGESKAPQPMPLNTAIIAYQETYYVSAIASPGNFPRAKQIRSTLVEEIKKETTVKPVLIPLPQPEIPSTPPPPLPPVLPALVDTGDPYIPNNTLFIDQSTQWLKMNFSLNGSIYDGERSLSNIKIDREYWKVDIFTYWAPGIQPPRPPLEKDYFKLEIYDDENNKLIYTMTSGNDENIHKSQIFKKAGKYTFKASSKTNGQYEVSFLVSPTMAK